MRRFLKLFSRSVRSRGRLRILRLKTFVIGYSLVKESSFSKNWRFCVGLIFLAVVDECCDWLSKGSGRFAGAEKALDVCQDVAKQTERPARHPPSPIPV